MKNMKNVTDLIPGKRRTLSPEEFLKLNTAEKRNVESCRYVPPTLGSSGFGRFVAVLRHPVYSIDGKTK